MKKRKTENVRQILDKQIFNIKPNEKELGEIEKETDKIIEELKREIKKRKIKAEVFIGGSLAKKTIIKKKSYDIDTFVRFIEDKDISDKLEKLLKGKAMRIHGSRDYFQVNKRNLVFEIIPVLKISKPEQAKNITDLSYFHVNYVLNNIKKKPNLAGEIMLAKAFCHAQNVYGAESYIKGFSGYALELLVIHYKSFMNFLKATEKIDVNAKPIVIDPSKFYKNKEDVMNNLNEAKLVSPVVFVDPTFKERNALAALSKETFSKFQKACKEFLKKPSLRFFEEKKINENKFNLILEIKTNKQEGDIAGSKLLKFSRFFESKIEKYFKIKEKDFEYAGKKGKLYLKAEKRKEILFNGPPVNKLDRLVSFKSVHKNVFIKNHTAFAREKVSISAEMFVKKFISENKQVMKDMGITGLRIAKS